MKTACIIIGALLMAAMLGCSKQKPKEIAVEQPEQRLKVLYAKQDALYAGRYGGLDAAVDISKGTPKLLWHGLFRSHDGELIAILKKRFTVEVRVVAACEASPALVNYADAYNARIMERIALKFGASAYADAEKAAINEHWANSMGKPDRPSQPTPGS